MTVINIKTSFLPGGRENNSKYSIRIFAEFLKYGQSKRSRFSTTSFSTANAISSGKDWWNTLLLNLCRAFYSNSVALFVEPAI